MGGGDGDSDGDSGNDLGSDSGNDSGSGSDGGLGGIDWGMHHIIVLCVTWLDVFRVYLGRLWHSG